MSPRFLLDTNTVSEPVRDVPSLGVVKKMKTHGSEMAIATVVWHELLFGIERLEKSKKRDKLQQYFSSSVHAVMTFFSYDEKAAHWHALERARLQKLGIQVPFADFQIAAIAYTNDLILVTRNERDFKHLKGLKVENWFV